MFVSDESTLTGQLLPEDEALGSFFEKTRLSSVQYGNIERDDCADNRGLSCADVRFFLDVMLCPRGAPEIDSLALFFGAEASCGIDCFSVVPLFSDCDALAGTLSVCRVVLIE